MTSHSVESLLASSKARQKSEHLDARPIPPLGLSGVSKFRVEMLSLVEKALTNLRVGTHPQETWKHNFPFAFSFLGTHCLQAVLPLWDQGKVTETEIDRQRDREREREREREEKEKGRE